MASVATRTTLKEIATTGNGCHSNEGVNILNSDAQSHPIIKENQHFIKCYLEHQFKCELCKKNVLYNKKQLYSHLNSKKHQKLLKKALVLDNLNELQLSESNATTGNGCHTNVAVNILNSDAHFDSLIKENQRFITCYMQPQFKCQLCNKQMAYSKKEKIRIKHFYAHLKSKKHQKRSSVLVLKEFKKLKLSSRCKFTLTQGKVFCKTCKCEIETNLDKLVLHARGNSNSSIKTEPPVPSDAGQGQKILTVEEFKILMDSLGKPLNDFEYIIDENGRGNVRCLICDILVPATAYDIETHFVGIRHKDNKRKKTPNPPSNEPRSKLGIEQIYKTLVETDPLIRVNSKLFLKQGRFYICVMCGAMVESCNKVEVFQHNFHSHINSIGHVEKLKVQSQIAQIETDNSKINELFEKLPSELQKDIKYIKGPWSGNMVACFVCTRIFNADSLQSHLQGSIHASAVHRFDLLVHSCDDEDEGNETQLGLLNNVNVTSNMLNI